MTMTLALHVASALLAVLGMALAIWSLRLSRLARQKYERAAELRKLADELRTFQQVAEGMDTR